MAIVQLSDAVRELVRDGDSVALEGFTHLIPHAAGHELVRQGRRDLTLIRMTPDIVYDQLIGMGAARRVGAPAGPGGRGAGHPVPLATLGVPFAQAACSLAVDAAVDTVVKVAGERLGAEAYSELSYCERWTASIAWNLMQRGVLTSDELGRRMAEIEKAGRQ